MSDDAEPLPQPELTAAAQDGARAGHRPAGRRRDRPELASIDPARAWQVHVDDSLSGLGFDAARRSLADRRLGAGAGFPGLVLAAMLPAAQVDLIEAIGRKCEFIDRAAAAGGIANAHAVNARAEDWAARSRAGRHTTPSRRAPSPGSARSPSSPRRC